ncbi:hypothetical protein TYRP_005397 [Tyrophagus putrescentiae]|nr:hypothetical protein TYRP_005397 [Tyrophagus putrescentiae]
MYVSGAQIKRRGLGSLGSPKPPADEGLASGASGARVGGRSQCPSVVRHNNNSNKWLMVNHYTLQI